MKLVNPLTAIFHPPPTPGVLAVFAHVDATVEAIGQLRRGGHTDFTVYSPIPRHEIENALDQPVSPVRMFTLVGGIAGCAIGAWLTLYMSYDWPIVVGGKPVGSIPPYVVIMFEMTILFGAPCLGPLPPLPPLPPLLPLSPSAATRTTWCIVSAGSPRCGISGASSRTPIRSRRSRAPYPLRAPSR